MPKKPLISTLFIGLVPKKAFPLQPYRCGAPVVLVGGAEDCRTGGLGRAIEFVVNPDFGLQTTSGIVLLPGVKLEPLGIASRDHHGRATGNFERVFADGLVAALTNEWDVSVRIPDGRSPQVVRGIHPCAADVDRLKGIATVTAHAARNTTGLDLAGHKRTKT